jgi:hypothetical protein
MSKKGRSLTVPFVSLLALLVIGGKITGHITWSWWWILGPIWVPSVIVVLLTAFVVALVLGALLVLGAICLLVSAVEKHQNPLKGKP